jgi:hypothetical protein
LRDLEPLSLLEEVVLLGFRTGEESLEPRGEGAMEFVADDCLDVWLSDASVEMVAVELAMEFSGVSD